MLCTEPIRILWKFFERFGGWYSATDKTTRWVLSPHKVFSVSGKEQLKMNLNRRFVYTTQTNLASLDSKQTRRNHSVYLDRHNLPRGKLVKLRVTIRITNRCDFSYYVFISFFSSFPNMFRAFMSPSSGVFQAVVFMLPFGSPKSPPQTSPLTHADDQQSTAWTKW